jgi:hypothetical protein
MNKFFLSFLIILQLHFFVVPAFSQELSSTLDSLRFYGDVFSNAVVDDHRIIAAKEFERLFGKILEEENALSKIEEIPFISRQIPPDSSFAIFTWRLALNNMSDFNYYGYIYSPHNEFRPIRLENFMKSGRVSEFAILSPDHWPGAFYYGIKHFQMPGGKDAWLLFGVNGFSRFTRVRIMDVLHRTGNDFYFGYPVFGENAEVIPRRGKTRVMMEYSFDAPVYLNFDPEYELIVMNVVEKKTGVHPGQGVTGIPTGDYHGYNFEDGYWIYVPEIVRKRETPEPPPPPNRRTGPRRDLFGNPLEDRRN